MKTRPFFSVIRERREELGMSQAAVAERAGVSRKTLVQIEKGLPDDHGLPDRGISFASLMRVTRVLGLEISIARRAGRSH